VVDDSGTVTAAYDKVHLVPFGEYLPFRSLWSWLGLRQLVALPGGFSPGAARMILTLDGAPPFVPLICYEIVFPGEAVPAGPRPGWILNLTNDAWFGATPGPYQHLLQGRVRAVEDGLPVVRAANSGISAIVDAYGRIDASLGLGQVGSVDSNLPSAAPLTLYTQFGDVIFLLFLVISVAAVGLAARGGTGHN
jgi:apolipoprotein N-acyltransferase